MLEQPPWLAAAWAELGQREVRGSADNARIRALFREVGHPAILHDEVAWCAAFVGACLERGGLASTRSLMARSYLRWGDDVSAGRIGAVAVLSRGRDPAAGHVGFLMGETPTHVVLLGGNQGDAVSVAAYPKTRLLGLRWPAAAAAKSAGRKEAGTRAAGDALFDEALAHVLEMEGGYTDDPHDPGGPTNRGITLATYAAWQGVRLNAATRSGLKAELRRIGADVVRDIYFARYWSLAHCSEMAPALAFFHFDAAVNHGVTGAMRLLQRAVGTDVDGEIGPNTRAAIGRLSVEQCLERYAEVRRARYRALPHFWRFGRGWLRRVDTTLARARKVVRAGAGAQQATDQVQEKEMSSMNESVRMQEQSGPVQQQESTTKWWGQSITIWGAMITALSTVLPAIGPAFGVDITGDLVREAGEGIVLTVQAVGGLIGTLMTIYGRMRASTGLTQRSMQMKL
ncbi:TIGR02594 family protein [Hyphomicrobium sulfonivorans]|uniref:TIGR02594 family protein n=1 Tax=Hyphomicrobium sulfonivorans TaxID=121290 RepID=UPI00156EFCE3|nr:TIGR02594 family protein [Hyphomicrobium sulfonivorans]NSL71824.1 TIGR02594 family protein [Hyphomicrobium sulfonivorans]